MSSLLEKLAAAHKAKMATSTTPVQPLFATSGITEAREKQRTREVAATDVLDAHRHSLFATVLGSNKHWSAKCLGMSELVIAVTSIEENGSPVIARVPETGNTFLIATAKDPPPGGQKIKLPRYIAPECAIVRIDGVVKLSISNARNGHRGGEFVPGDLPVGSKVKLTGVNLNYKLSKPTVDNPTPTGAVYLETESIEILATPTFPTDGHKSAIHAVLNESHGALFQAAIDVDTEIGMSNTALTELADADRGFLCTFFENLIEKYEGCKVGVGEVYERFLISPDDAKTSIEEMLPVLTGELDNKVTDPTDVFLLNSSNTRCPVFIQHAPGVVMKSMMKYSGSGFGAICTLRNQKWNPDLEEVDDFAVAEMTLVPRDERVDGALPILTKAVKFDLFSGIAARSDKTKTFQNSIACIGEKALSTHLPLFTTKRLKDDFGIFDTGRLHDISFELIPNANMIFFPKLVPRSETVFTMPIQAAESEWGMERYIIDVVGAIKDVGIKVSRDFVKASLVDDDDCFKKPTLELFATNHDDNALKMQRKTPSLEGTGFVALNSGKLERSFTALVKRLPEGSSTVEFYAVFPGSAELHDENTKYNSDETTGDALLKSMNPSKKSLDAFLLNKAVVYAIAVKTHKRKAGE